MKEEHTTKKKSNPENKSDDSSANAISDDTKYFTIKQLNDRLNKTEYRKEKHREELKSLPWIEKYRPYKLMYLSLDGPIQNQIEHIIREKNMNSIILEGPPGVGKTSTLKCMAVEMYGPYYKDMVLEMNASDDRGIKIHDIIENFRKAYVHIKPDDIDKYAKFKLIILDEADNMTDKAKHIIAEFLKATTNDLRFAFTCNSKINILADIQSACHIIKYPRLVDKIIFNRLKLICELEGIITNGLTRNEILVMDKGIKAICDITNGDMRNGINLLQLTFNRFKKINENNVFKIHDKPHPEKSREIIDACINKDLRTAITKIVNMRKMGYSGTDIALGLDLALRLDICKDIPEEQKLEFLKKISYSTYNISKGLDSSLLQISACVSDMISTQP